MTNMKYGIVVIGVSLGGLWALKAILSALPGNFCLALIESAVTAVAAAARATVNATELKLEEIGPIPYQIGSKMNREQGDG